MKLIFSIATLITAILAFPLGGILADTPVLVPDRVEEDWELVIETPDVNQIGPQITTTMSPNHDNSTFFVAFDLNYREFPTFQPGGMQIQVWKDKEILATSSQGTELFSTPAETVTWTQRMSIEQDGTIKYHVTDGHSTTWGSFGQGNGLLNVNFPTSLNSLTGYDAAYSASNSAVSWQSNHATSMTLVRVRYYASGRLITTDNTARSISLTN